MWSWRADGWGAFVWLAVSVALVAIRTPHLVPTTPIRSSSAVRSIRLWMFTGVWLAGLVLPLIHLTTGLLAPADYLLPDWATAAGAAFRFPSCGCSGGLTPTSGENWSWRLRGARARPRHARAVYASVRHPMYLAMSVSALVPALAHPTGSPVPRDPGLRRLVCRSHPSRGGDVRRSILCCVRRLCRPHAAELPGVMPMGLGPEWRFLKP